jgi:hypothetical protein
LPENPFDGGDLMNLRLMTECAFENLDAHRWTRAGTVAKGSQQPSRFRVPVIFARILRRTARIRLPVVVSRGSAAR